MIRTFQAPHSKPKADANVLNQRDIVNAIDNCPQIIREDKLFLRTKIKQFFKDFQLGEQNTPQDISQLLQIFNQCRKPLPKIHLYDSHLHWLQVKLRKYILNERKKHKIECLNQFKRQKINEQCKKMNTIRKRYKNEEFGQTSYHWQTQNDQIRNYTQQLRKLQSPPQKAQNNRFIGSSHNRNLSANMSPSHEVYNSNFYQIQSCKNATSRLPIGSDKFGFKNKRSISKQSQRKQNIPQKNKINNVENAENKRVSFSQNAKRTNKQNQSNNFGQIRHNNIINQELEQQASRSQHQQHFYNKYNVNEKPSAKNPTEQMSQKFADISLDHWSPYKYDSKQKKAQDISSIKQIKYPITSNVIQTSAVSNFQVGSTSDAENLYTSPQLLEQCRRLIKFSQKQAQFKNSATFGKTQRRQNIQTSNQYNAYIRPVINVSAQFTTVKQVLKSLFTANWRVYLAPNQKQAALKKCHSSIYEKVDKVLNKTNKLTNYLSFIEIFPDLAKNLGLNFAFGNVFHLLDVESKGFINPIDYQVFIQNFQQCPIDPQILNKLKDKLKRFEDVVNKKFAGTQIVPGCFQYLQLIQNKQIFQLCEVLQLFQFQIDPNHSNVEYQQ